MHFLGEQILSLSEGISRPKKSFGLQSFHTLLRERERPDKNELYTSIADKFDLSKNRMTLNLKEKLFVQEESPNQLIKELKFLSKKVLAIEKYLEESS